MLTYRNLCETSPGRRRTVTKRAANWQEMMRLNLELRLISVAAPTRARRVPVLFTGGESNWLSQLPAVARGKNRSH